VPVGSLILRTSASRFLKLMKLKSLFFPFFENFQNLGASNSGSLILSEFLFFLALGLQEIKKIGGSHERTGSLG
jgi:hypothetical protein